MLLFIVFLFYYYDIFLCRTLIHQRMIQDFEEFWIASMTTFWIVFCEACWIVLFIYLLFFKDKQFFGWFYAQLVTIFWIALYTTSSHFF